MATGVGNLFDEMSPQTTLRRWFLSCNPQNEMNFIDLGPFVHSPSFNDE